MEPFMKFQDPDASTDTDPDYVVGLRRTLAGCYAHTGAHILAAPMAHYVALKGTRFHRSHKPSFIPVQGFESTLQDKPMIMNFKHIEGEYKAYHKSMDYIHRPVEFEDMCSYILYEIIEIVEKRFVNSDQEFFHLHEKHPLHKSKVAIYREVPAVPVFGWSWLPSTKDLGSLFDWVPTSHHTWDKRERYCLRFLLLFHPFRSMDDLKSIQQNQQPVLSHQNKFREALPMIDPALIKVANNIQNITNSMNSKMPDNLLLDSTELETEIEEEMERQEAEEDTILSRNLDAYLARPSPPSENVVEPTSFKPAVASYPNTPLGDVYETDAFKDISDNLPQQPDRIPPDERRPTRFVASTRALNSLLMTTHDARLNNQGTFRADGSAESIISFGKTRGLDSNQQLAFQIIVATYVLTFYDEASPANDNLDLNLFESEIIRLRELAKPLNPTSTSRLRMLVTGPAGAGKSAILESMMIYCRKFSREVGHIFDPQTTIVMSSLTGSSAISIGGDTTARRFGLRCKKGVKPEEQTLFEDTRLCIIDEVGFMDYDKDLVVLNQRLRAYTKDHGDEPFGNMDIVFLGDFHQLEPVGQNCLYNHEFSLHWEQALNCMVELHGTHRFRNCPHFSVIMPQLRKGIISHATRRLINSRYVDEVNVKVVDEVLAKTLQVVPSRRSRTALLSLIRRSGKPKRPLKLL